MTEERRISDRKDYLDEITFESMAPLRKVIGLVCHRARCMDISSGGIGMVTSQPVSAGEVVRLALMLKDAKRKLPVFAEVRWVLHDEHQYKVGLEYLA